MKKIILISLIVSLGLAGAGFLGFKALELRKEKLLLVQKQSNWQQLKTQVRNELNRFNQEAGVVIKDLSTGWVFSINKDKFFASASMVKVPIMASLMVASCKGEINLKSRLVLKNSFKVSGSGVLKDRVAGSEFSIEDLIELMITESDNTAANMLIDYMGFDTLNKYFKKLGLNNTNIVRLMMDFDSRQAGVENYTTAQDLAFLLDRIYNNRLINKSVSRKCLEVLKRQKIRDRIPAKLPFNTIVAHKTGLERNVCHDAGIVFTPKGDFVICVLTKHNNKIARPAKRFISRVALDVYNYYNFDLGNS